MTGRDEVLEYIDLQRKAGAAVRTLQWKFADKWDEAGRRVCVWCGRLLPQGKQRQRWCSQKCVEEAKMIKGDMGQVRGKLRKREDEKCQKCGQDLKILSALLHQDLSHLATPIVREKYKIVLDIWSRWRGWFGASQRAQLDNLAAQWVAPTQRALAVVGMRNLLQSFSRRSLWQADHIVEVHEGGSGTDLRNFQLLCVKCHLEKTNAKKAAAAAQRRALISVRQTWQEENRAAP